MRRWVVVGGILTVLLICGAGVLLRGQASAAFILPGASEIVERWQGPSSLQLRYTAAGNPFDWRRELGRRLERAGWSGRSYTNMGATRPPFATVWYTRQRRLGQLAIVERAILGGDPDAPNTALVEVSREIYLGDTLLLGGRRCLFCWGL